MAYIVEIAYGRFDRFWEKRQVAVTQLPGASKAET